ncbi:MAG: hypothetical protein RL459_336 [Pseudomonadota bacterium]|jgi:peptidoglycan-associated lipoprotein
MSRLLAALGLVAVLAGCSSAVKLDEVPVEDKSGASVAAKDLAGTAATGDTSGVSKSAVASVDLSKARDEAAAMSDRIVYFDYDSFVVKPEFQKVLEAQARFLTANKARKVAIEGHTDERGGREYNLALGQKRAEAVRRALALLGVSDAQVEAVSFGKEKLAATGGDESAMAKNRRAEFSYR